MRLWELLHELKQLPLNTEVRVGVKTPGDNPQYTNTIWIGTDPATKHTAGAVMIVGIFDQIKPNH